MKIRSFLNKATKLTKDLDFAAVAAVSGYFLISLMISSVKLSFIVSFIFFAFLVYRYSFYKAMVYSMLPLLYFGMGQAHSFIAVPASAVYSLQYWEGRQIGFSFSPFFAIFLSGLLLLLLSWRKQKISFQLHEKLMVILFGVYGLSFTNSIIPFLSMLYLTQELLLVVWGIYLVLAIKNIPKIQVKKIFYTLAIIIMIILLQDGLLVFGQFIKGNALGLAIEKTQVAPSFGLGADERAGVFRPFGFNLHPNGLANEVILLGMSALILLQYLSEKFIKKRKIINQLSTIVVIVSFLIIILSLSRAALVAVFASLVFFVYRHPNQLKKINNLQRIINRLNTWFKVILVILLGVIVFKLTNRMFDSIYSFTEFGGVSTRVEQYIEALEVYKNSPIFGVGMGMFIPASYQLFPDGVMRYFPEPVHNGFLLFLVERGIVSVLVYVFFALNFYLKIKASSLSEMIKTMIYSGILSSFIMMIFHPQKNFLSFLIILIIFIIHYEKTTTKI
ncbi:MAG: O-antigen ligase family protein [Candidatus Pacebacteria bacterium]|nr:O-antigen ligase family protein [Candidatus Paceibacterota bacterium]MBT4004745.1 O-antigen ligase family protein [Candidatus Paceibacterota bacterium]MBT6899264.1 O-antigen ligase family protein [Candidatus Paceibacterota bacterium]MBT7184164.1 O-antigen ligase family protein [Candidatus Paceibacterota bacterium]MBT7310004.1 O-antigen ligase family protein [Candidatus Paceibacterota bacterium]